ncbi:MAG: hypothetical protein JJT76_12520 [Clostridiaceae bacterium]|nr:hypothetical protein [Clostridiaceae bacterium]
MRFRKRLKLICLFGVFSFFCFAYQTDVVFANSSWRWLTSSPKELLPIAIISTLAIEYTGILYFQKLKKIEWKRIKVLGIVIAANLASFVLPIVTRAYEMRIFARNWLEAWEYAFDKGPFYIVMFGYLFMTIAIEIPIIYGYLRKYTMSKNLLITLIITLNIITTGIVAVLERILYKGQW